MAINKRKIQNTENENKLRTKKNGDNLEICTTFLENSK